MSTTPRHHVALLAAMCEDYLRRERTGHDEVGRLILMRDEIERAIKRTCNTAKRGTA